MAAPSDKISTKLFIGGLSSQTKQEDLLKYFTNYGEITDCVVMYDKVTGRSRGFGFVTFKNPDSVDEALRQKHKINDKELDCNRAIPRAHDEDGGDNSSKKTKKLFVGGLPQGLPEDEFRKYFDKFGHIEDSVIMMDRDTGKSRGFGFITFDNEESVDKVIEQYNENKIDGKWIECKKAMPRDGNDFRDGAKRGGGMKFDRDERYSGGRSDYRDKDRYNNGGGGGGDRGFGRDRRERGFGDSDKDKDRGGRGGDRNRDRDRDDRNRDRGRDRGGERTRGYDDQYGGGDRGQTQRYSQGGGSGYYGSVGGGNDPNYTSKTSSYNQYSAGYKDLGGDRTWGGQTSSNNYGADSPKNQYGVAMQQGAGYSNQGYSGTYNPSLGYQGYSTTAQGGAFNSAGGSNMGYNYGSTTDATMMQQPYMSTQPSYMGAQTTGTLPSSNPLASYGNPTQGAPTAYGTQAGDSQYPPTSYMPSMGTSNTARPGTGGLPNQSYAPNSYATDPAAAIGGPIKGNTFQTREDRHYKPY